MRFWAYAICGSIVLMTAAIWSYGDPENPSGVALLLVTIGCVRRSVARASSCLSWCRRSSLRAPTGTSKRSASQVSMFWLKTLSARWHTEESVFRRDSTHAEVSMRIKSCEWFAFRRDRRPSRYRAAYGPDRPAAVRRRPRVAQN